MLEQIGIDRKIEREIIKSLLSDIFKDLRIHYFDQETSWEIEDEDKLDENSICFSLIKMKVNSRLKLRLHAHLIKIMKKENNIWPKLSLID
jgi:hypothetical protein